jgi:hypothetical protein
MNPVSRVLVFPPELRFLAPTAVDDLIRIGSADDGGYVVPRSVVPDVDFLLSFGVNVDWSFDEDLKRLNPAIGIHAYDFSVGPRVFWSQAIVGVVKTLLGIIPFAECRQRIRKIDGYRQFFSRHATHFRERINDRKELPYDVTLDEVFARTQSEHIFLKMDIEGSEYAVMPDVLRHAARVNAIAIEFHAINAHRREFIEAMAQLQTVFELVHLHANNYEGAAPDGLPDVLELTFVKVTGVRAAPRRTTLPLPGLDAPNHPTRPDFTISVT